MRVDTRQMEVAARVLVHPRLTYGSPANYDPKGARGEGGGGLGGLGQPP